MATSSVQIMCKFCADHIMSWTVASMISRSLNTILFYVSFKRKCIQKNPHSLDELKQNIQGHILNMTEISHTVASSMRKTADAYIAEHVEHFQQLLCNSVSIISIVE